MPPADRLPAGALVVRKSSNGAPFSEAKWRYRGQQRLRRVGPAWLVDDGDGGWKPRPGRVPADAFDEKRATATGWAVASIRRRSAAATTRHEGRPGCAT